jgi:uncharacterized membrane protein
MAHITGDIVIDRPVGEVFDFVADERNEPRYNPRMHNVDKLSDGPIGTGTRYRAETTTRGRSTPMIIEVTAYERPRRLASSTHMSTMDFDGELTFDRVPAGTRMRWSWEVRPHGAFRLITPLIARIGRRQEQAIWASLKRYLEDPTTGRSRS